MWYITTYQPVSLISLKLATATSTGGKSLLLPSPYALKMALLDVIIKTEGVDQGQSLWPTIRDSVVAIRGPQQIVVTNTFTKILKPMKGKPELDEETGLTRSMINTIGFREYVQWQGELQIAFQLKEELSEWQRWLTAIHYIGKRGGFLQATDVQSSGETLPNGFARMDLSSSAEFRLDGTLQLMDDCGTDLGFEQVDIYSSKNMRLGKDRILRPVILPYRVIASSRGYTLYQRVG